MSFRRIQRLKESYITPITARQKSPALSNTEDYIQFHFSQQKYAVERCNQPLNTIHITPKTNKMRVKYEKTSHEQKYEQEQKKFELKKRKRISSRPLPSREDFSNSDFTQDVYESPMRQKKLEDACLNIRPNIDAFTKLLAIGKGAFGRVWKVMEKRSKRIFAMKIMRKTKIIDKKAVNSAMYERDLLAQLSHPFMVNMKYAFQDEECLYLIMDYCSRGDLRSHLIQLGRFHEHHTRFFLACVVLCLEYLHSFDIIHRDLKPENLVLDQRGYVKVTDFGMSRLITSYNRKDNSGTPGYMAPQVVLKRNHSYCVDFYALGIIAYEFMTGKRPILGSNLQEIRQQLIPKQFQLKNAPQGWSDDSVDFINRLIQRLPEQRLGFNGIDQIKSHSFFKTIDWQLLHQKKIFSPFIPKTIDEDYSIYRQGIAQKTELKEQVRLPHQDLMKLFDGYDYDGNWEILQRKSYRGSTVSRKKHQSK